MKGVDWIGLAQDKNKWQALVNTVMNLPVPRNSPHFMEPESSLPYSQAPATCPCPEPNPSSPHNPLPLPEDPSSFGVQKILFPANDFHFLLHRKNYSPLLLLCPHCPT